MRTVACTKFHTILCAKIAVIESDANVHVSQSPTTFKSSVTDEY